MNALKKTDKMYWILLGVLGLLIIIFHKAAANVLPIVAGVGLIVAGVVGLIGWWGMRSDKSSGVLAQFVGALLMVVFGIWAVTHPGSFGRLINIAAAVILIWTCVQKLIINHGFMQDKVIAVVSVVGVVLGILMLLGGLNILSTGLMMVGCGMIYTACVGLLTDSH